MDHDYGDGLLVPDRPQQPMRNGPLDSAMQAIWQAGDQFAHRLNQLVPFPTSLPVPSDAQLTRCFMAVSVAGHVEARVDYRSDQELDDIAARYQTALEAAGLELASASGPDGRTVIRGTAGSSSSSTHSAIEDLDTHRSVSITSSSERYQSASLLDNYADWHHRTSLLPSGHSLDRFGLEASENPYSGTISTWYTTTYRLAQVDAAEAQRLIEHRLSASGEWDWTEPKEHVLFLTGPFDAEIHLRQDGDSSTLEFVGEFSVAAPAT